MIPPSIQLFLMCPESLKNHYNLQCNDRPHKIMPIRHWPFKSTLSLSAQVHYLLRLILSANSRTDASDAKSSFSQCTLRLQVFSMIDERTVSQSSILRQAITTLAPQQTKQYPSFITHFNKAAF